MNNMTRNNQCSVNDKQLHCIFFIPALLCSWVTPSSGSHLGCYCTMALGIAGTWGWSIISNPRSSFGHTGSGLPDWVHRPGSHWVAWQLPACTLGQTKKKCGHNEFQWGNLISPSFGTAWQAIVLGLGLGLGCRLGHGFRLGHLQLQTWKVVQTSPGPIMAQSECIISHALAFMAFMAFIAFKTFTETTKPAWLQTKWM